MSDYYVYSLTDPRSGLVYYVGVTSKPTERLTAHTNPRSTKNPKLRRIASELAHSDMRPKMNILEVVCKENRFWREKYWIHWHIEHDVELCNINGQHTVSDIIRKNMHVLEQMATIEHRSVKQIVELIIDQRAEELGIKPISPLPISWLKPIAPTRVEYAGSVGR